jgi:hypothetical protein
VAALSAANVIDEANQEAVAASIAEIWLGEAAKAIPILSKKFLQQVVENHLSWEIL